MKTIGIREAKANLSRLVSSVECGDSIILTLRGRPAAKIVPLSGSDRDTEAPLAELEQRGWIKVHTGPSDLPPPIQIEAGLAQRYLREDRDRGE